jgi:arylsulfatase A-like enzyme
MAWPGPAPTWKRIAAGAAAGVATAIGLVAAEVGTSLLLDAPLPPRVWAFLALYCVPAFAIAGALGALLFPLPQVGAVLVWLPALAYCVSIVDQDLLSGLARVPGLRLAVVLASVAAIAAAARVTEWALARCGAAPVPAQLLRMAQLFAVVAAAQVAARVLRGAPAAAFVLPVAVAAAAVLAVTVTAPLLTRLSARAAATAGAVALGVIALAGGWRAALPAPGSLRDQAQPAPLSPDAAPAPSVVLIVLDAARASSLSCYGYERRTTPHLDAFAAAAVRFAAATTVSPWSVPSHASLFTGLFAPEHGAGSAQRDPRTGRLRPAPLDAGLVTLAEALAERGYATAGISANPLVAPHTRLSQGFRYFDVRPSPRALTPRYRTLLQRAQSLLPAPLLAGPLRSTFPSATRSAAEITDSAVGWLDRRPSGQPYLLFLNYMDAHTPFVDRPGFTGRWPGRSPRLPSYGLPAAAWIMSGERPLSGEESSHLRALYDDALSYLDHHLGRLLAVLDAQPDRDRTWIIVTADHGEQLGEHQRLGHDCLLSQQVMHVPLVMRYPRGSVEASRHGTVEDRPLQLTDLAPAILTAARTSAPRPEPPSIRRPMVASVDCFCWPEHPKFHGLAGQAVILDGLKYVDEQGRGPALFDLVADPEETRNLAAARPDDAGRLAVELQRWRAGLRAPPATAYTGDAFLEEALRALGYIR